jgi:hypothetical protein
VREEKRARERVGSRVCDSGRGGYLQHGTLYVDAEILTGIVNARR